MKLGALFRFLPDLAAAASFAVFLLAPGFPGAASPSDCRLVMVLEGLMIAASALVGIYLRLALVLFPLLALAGLVWFVGTGLAGLSLTTAAFAWGVVEAFVDGVRAHRGRFGMARENPDHPHRRYDRMLLLYVASAPLLLALRAGGSSLGWAVWGLAYFSLLAFVDTFVPGLFDRVPRAILRRLKETAGPEVRTLLGACADCAYVQPAVPARKKRPIRCALSARDARFPEYPVTPVGECAGFRRQGQPVRRRS